MKVHLFCILVWMLKYSPLQAASLFAILVGDTNAIGIQDSIQSDIDHMSKEMQNIEHYTDLTVSIITMTGEKVTTADLGAKLEELEIDSDDCVFFYFAGHGYRTSTMKDTYLWPHPYLSYEGVGLDLISVVKTIKKKQPRLLICMTDCCNNILAETYAPHVSSLRHVSPSLIKQNYRVLFQETTGIIMATSSKVGRYSYGLSSGGAYTTLFLSILKEETVKETFFGWPQILDRVGYELFDLQTPVYAIIS